MGSTGPESVLDVGDLRRVFGLLEDVAGATGVQALREQVLESLDRRDRAVADLLTRHLQPLLSLQAGNGITCAPTDSLSPRQTAVADLVASGLTNQQVAQELHITVDTVKKHLTAALKATGCTSRTQLALHRRGVVGGPDGRLAIRGLA